MRSLALIVCLFAAACSKKEEAAKTPEKKAAPVEKTLHSCLIQIKKKAEPVQGTGSAATEDEAKAKAFDDACAKLPEADRADCKDTKKWSATVTTMKTDKEVGATVKLETNVIWTGKSKGHANADEACKAANAAACKEAGDAPDCVDAGRFVKSGGGPGTEVVRE
jgi:hypothetical protein